MGTYATSWRGRFYFMFLPRGRNCSFPPVRRETLSNAERGISLPGRELFLRIASIVEINLALLAN